MNDFNRVERRFFTIAIIIGITVLVGAVAFWYFIFHLAQQVVDKI